MKRDWDPEELIDCWTLGEDDWRLLRNKTSATRLGFALLLKYFELDARFPRHASEIPKAAVDYVAQQVKVDPEAFSRYDWSGRSIKGHRAQIRAELGFHESTVGDEDKLAVWLAEEVCPTELREDRLREALLARCRAERIEPPGSRLTRAGWGWRRCLLRSASSAASATSGSRLSCSPTSPTSSLPHGGRGRRGCAPRTSGTRPARSG